MTDAMMLLRHVTKPLPWLPEDSANLELTAVSQCKARATSFTCERGKGYDLPKVRVNVLSTHAGSELLFFNGVSFLLRACLRLAVDLWA